MKSAKIVSKHKAGSSRKGVNDLRNFSGSKLNKTSQSTNGSEDKVLRLMINSLGVQAWLIKESSGGQYIFDQVNDEFASFYNKKAKDIIGQSVKVIYSEESFACFADSLKEARKKGSSYYNYEKLHGKSKKNLSARIAYKEFHGIHFYSGTVTDMTEHMQVLENFQREKEITDRYFDIAGVMLVVLDTKGNVNKINEKGCEILGYDKNYIIGKSWFSNFLPPGIVKSIKSEFNQLMNGKEPDKFFENSIINKNGEERLIYWHNSLLIDAQGKITGVISSGDDITENRKMQNELVNQKKYTEFLYMFSRSISESNDLVDLVKKSSSMLSEYTDFLGGRICIYKGIENEECFDSSSFGIYDSALGNSDAVLQKISRKKKPFLDPKIENVEYTYYGSKHSAFTGTYGMYFRQELQGILIIFTKNIDPTMNSFLIHLSTEIARAIKRKKLEIDKKYSDEKFISVFDATPDALAITDIENGKFMEVNKGFEDMTGYTREESIGKSPIDLETWVHPEERLKLVDKLIAEKTVHGYLAKLKRKNGSEFDALFSAAVMDFGARKSMLSIVKDISDRVRIENENKDTKQLLENITSTSPSFISLYDVDADKVLYSNKSILASLGYTKEDLEVILNLGGRSRNVFYHPDDVKPIEDFDERLRNLAEGEVIKIDYRLKDTKSRWQWFHHSASVFQKAGKGKPLLTINVFENITDRKQAEEESRKHNNEIELLYQAGKNLSGTLDLYEIYDKLYDIISKVADCNELVVTSYDPAEKLIYYKYLKSKKTSSRINVSKIPPIPLAPKGFGINSEVIRTGNSIIINDYEEYFRRVKTRYVVADTGEIVGDEKSTESPNSALIIPIKLEDKILGVAQIYSTKLNAYNEEQLKFVESLMHQVALATKNAIVFEQAQNEINERKIAQNNLKKSERNLRQFAESVPDVLYRLNYETGKYDFLSPVIESMLGYDIKEVLDDPYGFSDRTIHPDDRKIVENAIINHNKLGMVQKPLYVESRMIKKDGSVIWVRDSIKFEFKQGKIVAAIGAMSNITEEKIQEEKRRNRDEKIIRQQSALLELSKFHYKNLEANFRKINEISAHALGVDRVSIWLFNKDESALVCRDRYTLETESHDKSITLGSDEHLMLFKNFKADEKIIFRNLEKDPHIIDFIGKIQSDLGTTSTFIARVHLHGGVVGFLCLESKDISRTEWTVEEYDFAVSVSGFISLALESEERILAEDEIKKSLKDKELLLREIHHRVKNNLQVISSLLYLQSKKVSDKITNDALLESQQRIKSMTMIHERLYKSDDMTGINYGEYVQELTGTLFRSYRLDSSKVKLQLDVGKIRFDTDTAVHCGLIINELVSNSFKHAFPDHRSGLIKISLNSDKNNDKKFTLIVSDDGVGLKEDFDMESGDTLGVQLIKTLTEQIGGNVNVHRNGGTTFKIDFTIEHNGA